METRLDEVENRILKILDSLPLDSVRGAWTSDSTWTSELEQRIGKLGGELGYYISASDSGSPGDEGESLGRLVWACITGSIVTLPMVLRSEWAIDLKDLDETFNKLLLARADHRVMVFQQRSLPEVERVFDFLGKQISGFSPSQPGDRYLLAGFYWSPEPAFSHRLAVVRLRKGSNVRDRKLSIEEYVCLSRAAPAHLRDVLTVAMNSGMRFGEVVKLQWEQIDRKAMFIRLPAEATKERRAKNIPINHTVADVLRLSEEKVQRIRGDVFTYSSKRKPIKTRLRRSLKTACESVGIEYGMTKEGFRFHDLRATVDTYMDAAGVRETVRKRILGHTPQDMDRHYIRLCDEDLREGMARYTEWLDAQVRVFSANVDQNVDQTAKEG